MTPLEQLRHDMDQLHARIKDAELAADDDDVATYARRALNTAGWTCAWLDRAVAAEKKKKKERISG